MPLFLEVTLENVITEENSDAVFESELTGVPSSVVWTKNGLPITNSQRTIITSERKWYRLEIKGVKASDHGVYAITFHYKKSQASSAANLIVTHKSSNDRVLYTPDTNKTTTVAKHLRDTRVVRGDRIELEVIFKGDAREDYVWYRNNQVVQPNDRVILLNSKNCSILSILRSEVADTGIYSVVAQSKHGILSSFASVQVTEKDEDLGLLIEDLIPIFREMLPDEVETYEGEETRLICKAITNISTCIQWTKNGVNVAKSHFIAVDYGDCYIGLKALNITKKDKGEYTVVLHDEATGKKEVCKTFLTVNPRQMDFVPEVEITRTLESAVACCGSRVIFDCSFSTEDSKYFYVVWHVGHYRVERSNSRFGVICNGGEYLLLIKKLEPGMGGEVVCELRKYLPNQKSVHIKSCSSYLTVVPDAYKTIPSKAKLFSRAQTYDERFTIASPETDEEHFLTNIFCHRCCSQAQDEPVQDGTNNNGHEENPPKNTIIDITYCRLTEDGLYFVHATSQCDDARLTVYHIPSESDVLVVKWEDQLRCWYEVLLGQAESGEFAGAGVTSSRFFEVEAPPVGRIMRFRIRTAPIDCEIAESNVRIVPTPESELKPPKGHELQRMQDFEAKYAETGDIIGSGAFGSVILVQNKDKEYRAAKVIKTRTQKKRDAAFSEFTTMRRLRHPKMVQLIDAYSERDVFVLVMDYLWGGELFDRIVKEDHIKEVDVIPYVRQICEALHYLHSFKIAHLDLKPENIVCLSPNSGQVKLIDFGLAKVLDDSNTVKAIYGTRDYVAPEVLNFERLSLACDMWSLGVVTYVLLSGLMPFGGESWSKTSVNITRGQYSYDDITFHEISDLAKDFVDHLLLLKPTQRMSAADALAHAWIRQGPPKGSKAGPMKRTKENLKSYLANYKARWQRAGNVMIAAHRLRTQANSQRASAEKESTSNTI